MGVEAPQPLVFMYSLHSGQLVSLSQGAAACCANAWATAASLPA